MKCKQINKILMKELRNLFEINPVYFLERLSDRKATIFERHHINQGVKFLFNKDTNDEMFNKYIEKILSKIKNY